MKETAEMRAAIKQLGLALCQCGRVGLDQLQAEIVGGKVNITYTLRSGDVLINGKRHKW